MEAVAGYAGNVGFGMRQIEGKVLLEIACQSSGERLIGILHRLPPSDEAGDIWPCNGDVDVLEEGGCVGEGELDVQLAYDVLNGLGRGARREVLEVGFEACGDEGWRQSQRGHVCIEGGPDVVQEDVTYGAWHLHKQQWQGGEAVWRQGDARIAQEQGIV